jgi:hypothetical protein
MTWFRLDEKGCFHPKVVAAGNEAYGAWARAGQWCSEHLTDGVVPPDVAFAIAPPRVWNKLVEVGLCEKSSQKISAKTPQRIEIHDFLQYNPSGKDVRAERERKAANVKEWRDRRNRKRGPDVTGNTAGNLRPLLPGRNHGPDPDPDPDPKESVKNGAHTPPPRIDPDFVAIRDRVRHWPIFASMNAERLADEQCGWMMSKGLKLAWVLTAIDDAATQIADGATYQQKHKTLVTYMHNARKPRVGPATPATTRPVETHDDVAPTDAELAANRKRMDERAAAAKAERERRDKLGIK